jgi:Flp pilus assembly protein TadG
MTGIIHKLKTYLKEETGNISLMMGISAVPIFLAAGVALDSNRMMTADEQLQSLADHAALTGVATGKTPKEHRAAADAYMLKNPLADKSVEYTWRITSPEDDRVAVEVSSKIKGTLTKIAFGNKNDVQMVQKAIAEAEETDGYKVCVFATNDHAVDSIYLYGTGALTAESCALYSNSDSASAIHVQGNKTVVADGMYALGGVKRTGQAWKALPSFVQALETMDDPFDIEVDETASSTNDIQSNANVSLNQDKYRNITIKKGTATFTPGVHYITGTLTVQSQGKVVGNGVTLVLLGKNARIDLQAGGVLDLTAPTAAQLPMGQKEFAGFAIIGHTNDADEKSNVVNTLNGGAGSNIRGIVYTPNQKLQISGNSDFNVDSKYSPLIADTIELGGNGALTIGLDWAAYGFDQPEGLVVPSSVQVHLVE